MNPARSTGIPSQFGSPGVVSQSIPMSNQAQVGSQLSGQFQLSEPHGQAQSQSQSQSQSQYAQAQAQAAYIKFQASLQGQPQVQAKNLGSGIASSFPTPVPASSSANAKRASQRPPNKPGSSSNTNVASPLKTMELTPAPRRRKRKLPEKQIPEKIAALLPESAIYTKLLEFESRVDGALARKKADIIEYTKNPPRCQKTLRIYVFNTFVNQTQTDNLNSAEAPCWTLKIIGKILDDGAASDSDGMLHGHAAYPKFSSFFREITVHLDQNLYPDNHVITWVNSRSSTPHEGFEVKRKGDKEFTASIRLVMNYVPEKFKLSTALSQALGIEAETRSRVVTALWHYVKLKKLQDPNDPAFFLCDPSLRKVFGEEKIKFTVASQKLSQHLSPLQPLQLEHRVKLSGNNPSGNTCYDVLVDVPFPLEKDLSAFLSNIEKNGEIDAYDETITAAIKKMNEHRQRRAFFLGFSQSPAEFINTLVASQNRDLKAVAGDAVRNAEKERRSEFYTQSWVEDAIVQHLNRKSGVGGDTSRLT